MFDRQFARDVFVNLVASFIWTILVLVLGTITLIGGVSQGSSSLRWFGVGLLTATVMLIGPGLLTTYRKKRALNDSLSCTLDWRLPAANVPDKRPEYRQWTHAFFIATRHDKSKALIRVRAFIEVEGTMSPDRTRAVVAGAGWFAHEASVKSGEQHHVPVFMVLAEPLRLWIDQRHIAYGGGKTITKKGSYVTHEAFFDHPDLRQPLSLGSYRLRVVLIVDEREFCTEWKSFKETA